MYSLFYIFCIFTMFCKVIYETEHLLPSSSQESSSSSSSSIRSSIYDLRDGYLLPKTADLGRGLLDMFNFKPSYFNLMLSILLLLSKSPPVLSINNNPLFSNFTYAIRNLLSKYLLPVIFSSLSTTTATINNRLNKILWCKNMNKCQFI